MTTHPTAIIDPRAHLGAHVEVGPFSVIGADVVLGDGCVIGPHVVIEGPTVLGEGCRVSAFAALGGAPQDRKHTGEPTSLVIGARAHIREHVTIHRGTAHGAGQTRIGDDVWIMAGGHVAHDCVLGDRVTLANGALLAGHVTLGDDVTSGGAVAVHQHVVVGRLAFLAAGAMVERDVPPFCRAAGDRASLVGLNLVGLQRAQAPAGSLVALRAAYRALFRAELPLQEALTRARASATDAYVLALLASVEASLAGQRQLCRPRVGAAGDEGP